MQNYNNPDYVNNEQVTLSLIKANQNKMSAQSTTFFYSNLILQNKKEDLLMPVWLHHFHGRVF